MKTKPIDPQVFQRLLESKDLRREYFTYIIHNDVTARELFNILGSDWEMSAPDKLLVFLICLWNAQESQITKLLLEKSGVFESK